MGDTWAEASRRYKRGQQEDPREDKPLRKGGYTSKSKKVWRDRFEAARKSLLRNIEWYAEGRRRGWTDSWFYNRLSRDGWVAKRYREARAAAKAHGAL